MLVRIAFILFLNGLVLSQSAFGLQSEIENPQALFLNTTPDAAIYELACKIKLQKNIYRPGESVIVNSRVENIGKRTLQIREPHAIARVVTFRLYRLTTAGQERIGGDACLMGGPSWIARIHQLKPGDNCSSSIDLDIALGLSINPTHELKPGQYLLRATYHLVDPRGQNQSLYDSALTTIRSNKVNFTVRELRDDELQERDIFFAAFNDAFPQSWKEKPDNELPLQQFLQNYPNSVYRRQALEALCMARYRDGNDIPGQLQYISQLRKLVSPDNVSTEQLDYFLLAEVSLLQELGNYAQALQLCEQSTSPNLILMKQFLLRNFKQALSTQETKKRAPLPAPVNITTQEKSPTSIPVNSGSKMVLWILISLLIAGLFLYGVRQQSLHHIKH